MAAAASEIHLPKKNAATGSAWSQPGCCLLNLNQKQCHRAKTRMSDRSDTTTTSHCTTAAAGEAARAPGGRRRRRRWARRAVRRQERCCDRATSGLATRKCEKQVATWGLLLSGAGQAHLRTVQVKLGMRRVRLLRRCRLTVPLPRRMQLAQELLNPRRISEKTLAPRGLQRSRGRIGKANFARQLEEELRLV